MAQSIKPTGPKKPARNLRESERLLAGAQQDEGFVMGLKVLGTIALALVSVGTLLYSAWDLLVAPMFH